MRTEVENWLKQAEADLRKAKILFDNRELDGVASNCQQTVEKSLKAVIIKEKNQLIKTHSLVKLGSIAMVPKELLIKIEKLETLHQESRYPDVSSVIPAERYDKEDAVEFVKIAEEVLQWCNKKAK